MKKSMLRKVLLLACSAVLLVCLSVGATLAYLTDKDTVENTFTVGKVKINLLEADVKTDGTIETDEKGNPLPRVTSNEYHLLPGHTYVKDPTVTVEAGSEDAYIRAFVTVSNRTAFDTLFAKYSFAITDWVKGLSGDWNYVGYTVDEENDTRTYELWYNNGNVHDANTSDDKLDAIFDEIVVPGKLSNDDIDTIKDTKITIVAQAIQADGFANATAAWKAFDEQAN